MPSNDERREVAAKLREMPIDIYEIEERWETEGLGTVYNDQTDYHLIRLALFGCLPADHMHPCDYKELHDRLADLIEPDERTCRNVSFDCGKLKCSACGKYTETWYHMRFGDMYTDVPNYCPNCGAKVVKE